MVLAKVTMGVATVKMRSVNNDKSSWIVWKTYVENIFLGLSSNRRYTLTSAVIRKQHYLECQVSRTI